MKKRIKANQRQQKEREGDLAMGSNFFRQKKRQIPTSTTDI